MKNKKHPLDEINTISDLLDRLSIENIRLWHLKDDVADLKKELENKNTISTRKNEIYKILAEKSFIDIDIVKKRSALKKAIDLAIINTIESVLKGKRSPITDEHKSYGK